MAFLSDTLEPSRLMIDPAQDGATNMAVDEAILTAVGRREALQTLRFYRWSEPTISLGHFQKYAEQAELDEPFKSLPVVRRITGGGAILHDAEITYSLILPGYHQLGTDTPPTVLYTAVHQALMEVLESLGLQVQLRGGPRSSSQQRGPFFCFQRSNSSDVMIDGSKITGSAQRRTLKALLQHGSFMLDNPLNQPGLATLADYNLNPPPQAEGLAQAWAQRLAEALGLEFCNSDLTQQEESLVQSLRSKYASDEWTKRR